ncbi:MAG: nitrilase-related carbon-nitrogen hydrolase, partial [Planctomycetaceae bacterium]
MKIALAQLNPVVGDLAGNTALVLEAAEEAASQDADLLVCSELVLCGYPPKDLLTRQSFVEACDEAVLSLAQKLPPQLGVLVGHPSTRDVPGGRIANAVSLLHRGELVATRHKVLLPNYDVFDERRYFRSGAVVEPIDFNGQKLGVHICEDAWW